MLNYEIVAFYKDSESEVSAHAERISTLYNLRLRYEQVSESEVALDILLSPATVMCVFNRVTYKFRKMMNYVYQLNKPVIIVHENDYLEGYSNLKVPVGYALENKEKVVWVNFFQRNNPKIRVELIVPREKDEDIAFMVENNVAFIEEVFHKSSVNYIRTFVQGSFEKCLKHIFQTRDNSIIFIMRPFRVFSFYYPYSIRMFRKYAHTPVLIIPRNEKLYIPCH